MVGTVLVSACFIRRVILTVVDTVINVISFENDVSVIIICVLERKSISVRICYGNSYRERVQVFELIAVFIDYLLLDVDTTLQGIGSRQRVGHLLDLFDDIITVFICSDALVRISGKDDVINISAHLHRVMHVCGEFEVLVYLAFFEHVIMTDLYESPGLAVPCCMRSVRIISGAVRGDHDSGSDVDVIGPFPILGLLEGDTDRLAVLAYEVVVSVDEQIQCDFSADFLALAFVKRVFPDLQSIELGLSESYRFRVRDLDRFSLNF